MNQKVEIAILDDYQGVSLQSADWNIIKDRANVTVFREHIYGTSEIIEKLQPFQIVCVMRERSPMTREILEALPNLKLIVSTGLGNASIDKQAVEELGIALRNTGYVWTGAPELTWALIMAIARKIPEESGNIRTGEWQTTIGTDLNGKTIGIVGLGKIGSIIANYARAFNMRVIAWSPNLTQEKATAERAIAVTKEVLFTQSDFISIHLVLSSRSKGIIAEDDFKLMKPTAYFINTSRGPIVDETALINALKQNKIAGAALDVFDIEPLPAEHPFRNLKNVIATPHIGYVTQDTYEVFYSDTLTAIIEWLSNIGKLH